MNSDESGNVTGEINGIIFGVLYRGGREHYIKSEEMRLRPKGLSRRAANFEVGRR